MLAAGLQWTRVFWFVGAHFAATGKSDRSQLSATLIAHLRDLHVLRSEIFEGRRDVVAHEVQLVPVVVFGVMESGFERRHGENQPTVAGIHEGELELGNRSGAPPCNRLHLGAICG